MEPDGKEPWREEYANRLAEAKVGVAAGIASLWKALESDAKARLA